jgi:lysophospholipase L1-like esterase
MKDEVLNHVWVPNITRTVSTFESKGVPVYVKHHNSQGWLSRYDFSQEKAPGVYRIAFVGDSFTEGTCAEEDTLPAIVQQRLSVPGRDRVEVMNTGTSSYAPTLYYLLLKTKLLSFHPDLIVINVDMTDVFDDGIYRTTLRVDANGDPIACAYGHPLVRSHRRTERGLEPLSLFDKATLVLTEYSRAARLVIGVAENLQRAQRKRGEKGIPALFAWCDTERSVETQEQVDWSMGILRRAIQLAKRSGAKVVVTGVPHLQQLSGEFSTRPMDDLAELCRSEDVPFLNPVDEFKKRLGSTPPDTLYIPDDMHFNPDGYRMWAEIQVEFLNSLGLP